MRGARLRPLCAALLCAALLAGCASPASHRRGASSYTVRGKTYYPLKSAKGFVEEGVASWYGPGFHGKRTANGETYNQYAMTAAHKLLPLGTKVRVTRLDNGRSVIVRVNDRGPFVDDRVIDLSRAAATHMGMMATGTAKVRVQSLDVVSAALPDGNMQGRFYVQVGAFGSRANAEALLTALRRQGCQGRLTPGRNGLVHVQAGPRPDLSSAERLLERLRGAHPAAFVVNGP